MRVIPKQEVMEAFRFNDLSELQDIATFISGNDNRMVGTVDIQPNGMVAVIRNGDHDVSINSGDWVVRSSAGVRIIGNAAFEAEYQRTY